MRLEKYGDVVAGAVVAAFAAFGLIYLVPAGVKSPPNVTVPALAPAFWPSIILWLLLGFAAIILVKGASRVRHTDVDDAAPLSANPERDLAKRTARTGAAILLLFIYQALIEPIGMVAASILAGLAFTALAGDRRYRVFVPLAVLLPIGLYYFFTNIAAIPIPIGFFENLEF